MKQHPFYLEDDDGLSYVLHRPPLTQPRQHAVIICGPAPFEFFRSHWTRNQIAMRLTKVGFDTFCFDYPATGDSDGDSKNFSLAGSFQSLQKLLEYAHLELGIKNISLVGMRLGANLALQASTHFMIKTLFMVDPIVSGKSYLNLLQTMQYEMLNEQKYHPPYPEASRGLHEALGYPLGSLLIQELEVLKLEVSSSNAQELVFFSSGKESREAEHYRNQSLPQGKKTSYLESADEFHWLEWQYTNVQVMPRTFLKMLEQHFVGGKK